jgi:IS30 family transposase
VVSPRRLGYDRAWDSGGFAWRRRSKRGIFCELPRCVSGYLFLLHLPDGKEVEKMDAAMRRAVTKLPGEFFRTVSWDEGKEMAKHASFRIDTGSSPTVTVIVT